MKTMKLFYTALFLSLFIFPTMPCYPDIDGVDYEPLGFFKDQIPIYSKALGKIIREHELWLTDEKKGKQADLNGADLHGYDFQGRNLSKINFKKANLSGANLESADLSGVTLSGVTFIGTKIRNTKFGNANFEDKDSKKK